MADDVATLAKRVLDMRIDLGQGPIDMTQYVARRFAAFEEMAKKPPQTIKSDIESMENAAMWQILAQAANQPKHAQQAHEQYERIIQGFPAALMNLTRVAPGAKADKADVELITMLAVTLGMAAKLMPGTTAAEKEITRAFTLLSRAANPEMTMTF